MSPWTLAFAELRAAPWRSLALAVLVGLAVAISIAIVAEERAVRHGTARAADAFDLLIGAPGSPTQLLLSVVYLQPQPLGLVPGPVLAALAGRPGVVWAAPVAFGDNWRGRPVIGTSDDLVRDGGRRPLATGRPFARRDEAVAGAAAGLAVGDTVTPQHGEHAIPDGDDHDHHGVTIRIVGVMPALGTPWDRAILVPVEALWAIHGLATGHTEADRIGPPWTGDAVPGVSAVVVKPRAVPDAYRLRLAHRTAQTTALFPAEVLTELYGLLGQTRMFLLAVAAAAQGLVLIAILVAATALVAVRGRQIAALRALGAPRLFIVAAVWIELALVLFAGLLLGTTAGYAATAALTAMLAAYTAIALPVSITVADVVPAAAAIAAGLVLAVIPALVAGAVPPGQNHRP